MEYIRRAMKATMTVKEASKITGISEFMIKCMIVQGNIQGIRQKSGKSIDGIYIDYLYKQFDQAEKIEMIKLEIMDKKEMKKEKIMTKRDDR